MVRTGKLAHAAADAPVVIDQHHAGMVPEGCPHRASLDAGRLLALLALHRHVEKVLVRHQVVVVVILRILGGKSGSLVGIAANLDAVIAELALFRISLVQIICSKGDVPFRHFHHLYPLNLGIMA